MAHTDAIGECRFEVRHFRAKNIPAMGQDAVDSAIDSGPQPAALGVPAAYSQGEGAALDPADLAQWWTRLNDPALSALIDQAIANNLDIVQAQARLRGPGPARVRSSRSS